MIKIINKTCSQKKKKEQQKYNLKVFYFFFCLFKKIAQNKEFFLLPIFISNGIFNSQRSEKC